MGGWYTMFDDTSKPPDPIKVMDNISTYTKSEREYDPDLWHDRLKGYGCGSNYEGSFQQRMDEDKRHKSIYYPTSWREVQWERERDPDQ